MQDPSPLPSNAAQWLRANRTHLGLSIADIAAFLCFRQKKTVNQARIVEMEQGKRPISDDTLTLLKNFFPKVEELRKQGRFWTEALL